MAPSSFRSAVALLVALAASAPGFADSGSTDADQLIPLAKLSTYTNPQFANLTSAAKSDRNKVGAIGLTKTMFDQAMHDPKQVPQDAEFTVSDVNGVGPAVAQVLGYVEQYQKAVAAAKAVAQSGDTATANRMVANAVKTLQTKTAAPMGMML
ncbi:MAG TPA: hypothetical protein VH309_13350, partial [Elusimicrobiota bacterium]|nr:hypothetical protein [Elusimicrobiota bacterium]